MGIFVPKTSEMKKTLLILLAFIASASILLAQNRMSPELLWKLGRVSGASLNPENDLLLYGVSEYDLKENKGSRNLYLVSTTGEENRQLTNLKGSEYNESWSSDGSSVYFMSSKSGDAQVWNIKTDGSGLKQVSFIEGGLGGFQLSRDESKMLFIQDVKLDDTVKDLYADLPKAEARVIDDLMYRHWSQWHDHAYSHVFYSTLDAKDNTFRTATDIMKDEAFDSPLNPFGGIEDITWSADGKSIVYTCKKLKGSEWTKSTNSDLYEYELEDGDTKNLTESKTGYDLSPVFSPDGKYMAWLSMARNGFESDKNDIHILNLESGNTSNVTASHDLTVSDFKWAANSSQFYFKYSKDATYQIFRVDLDGSDLAQLTTGDVNYGSFDVDSKGRTIYALRQNMLRPYEMYSLDLRKKKEQRLTEVNDKIYSNLESASFEKRWIETTDGEKMLTWVIYPPNFDPSKKYATLLYCQGGPQSAVSQFFSYRWNFQLMASNDYIIVAPNRRGLPGFGRKWNDDISKDWGGQCMEDYLSAIDALSKESYVDETKLGAIGASFGGYSVYWLAGNHNNRFKTFISHCGLFNLESWYGTTEEMFFANWDIGGPYWDSKYEEDYKAFSPHKFVKNWDTPIMVIHGEKDFRVPIGEGMQAFQVAQLKDIPSRFLYFPKEGHWVLNPQNGVLWHREFFRWLDGWLK